MPTNNLPRIESKNSLTLKGWAFVLQHYVHSGVELECSAVQHLLREILRELEMTEADMENLKDALKVR